MGKQSRARTAKEITTRLTKTQPLQTFFSAYPNFTFNPFTSSALEYRRLQKIQGWKRDDPAGQEAWGNFRSALVLEFNARFGTHARDLLAWQTLCKIVGLKDVDTFTNWEDCEKLLKTQKFNLIDVIDSHRRGNNEIVQTFPNTEELEKYTKKTGAFFPRYHVAAGGLLKFVLRRVPGTQREEILNE